MRRRFVDCFLSRVIIAVLYVMRIQWMDVEHSLSQVSDELKLDDGIIKDRRNKISFGWSWGHLYSRQLPSLMRPRAGNIPLHNNNDSSPSDMRVTCMVRDHPHRSRQWRTWSYSSWFPIHWFEVTHLIEFESVRLRARKVLVDCVSRRVTDWLAFFIT